MLEAPVFVSCVGVRVDEQFTAASDATIKTLVIILLLINLNLRLRMCVWNKSHQFQLYIQP